MAQILYKEEVYTIVGYCIEVWTGCRVGLIVNFGKTGLEYKRLIV